MFDKEITSKVELLEVIEALDKLSKDYLITKSQREVPEMSFREYNHKINVWHVKEV